MSSREDFSLTMVSLKGSSGFQKSSHFDHLPGCRRAAVRMFSFIHTIPNRTARLQIRPARSSGTNSSCENLLNPEN